MEEDIDTVVSYRCVSKVSSWEEMLDKGWGYVNYNHSIARTMVLRQLWGLVIALSKCSAMTLQVKLCLYGEDEEEDTAT